jgi:hypothetical protein
MSKMIPRAMPLNPLVSLLPIHFLNVSEIFGNTKPKFAEQIWSVCRPELKNIARTVARCLGLGFNLESHLIMSALSFPYKRNCVLFFLPHGNGKSAIHRWFPARNLHFIRGFPVVTMCLLIKSARLWTVKCLSWSSGKTSAARVSWEPSS